MTLILWDIDGTLLHSRGCGSAATRLAMQQVFGTVGTLDAFRFGGKTDWQMLLETLAAEVTPAEIEQRLVEYDAALAHHLEAIIHQYDVRACDGAAVLVERLHHDPAFTLAILTANMPLAASIKLRQAGYPPHWFQFGVFGSEAPLREKLTPIALERARQRAWTGERVIVIGDTPEDIACARAINAEIIAVTTGRYPRAELAPYQPDLLLDNLMDTDRIYAWLAQDQKSPA